MPMSVTAPGLDTMERTAPHVSHITPSVQSEIHYNTVMLMILKFCLFFVLSGTFHLDQVHSEAKPKYSTLPADTLQMDLGHH